MSARPGLSIEALADKLSALLTVTLDRPFRKNILVFGAWTA